eukprot:4769807-Prymnesium_polylepis.1
MVVRSCDADRMDAECLSRRSTRAYHVACKPVIGPARGGTGRAVGRVPPRRALAGGAPHNVAYGRKAREGG